MEQNKKNPVLGDFIEDKKNITLIDHNYIAFEKLKP